jgi:predicted nucleic acid-binding protein
MIYLDSSCLTKLLIDEPESPDVRNAVSVEEAIVISSLAELEVEVHLKAVALGGEIRASQWRHYQAKLAAMRNFQPFHFRFLPAAVFSTALKQHRNPRAAHCRTLDRMHLAAMEELKIQRLMTLDRGQANAAAALNYQVVQPGHMDAG